MESTQRHAKSCTRSKIEDRLGKALRFVLWEKPGILVFTNHRLSPDLLGITKPLGNHLWGPMQYDSVFVAISTRRVAFEHMSDVNFPSGNWLNKKKCCQWKVGVLLSNMVVIEKEWDLIIIGLDKEYWEPSPLCYERGNYGDYKWLCVWVIHFTALPSVSCLSSEKFGEDDGKALFTWNIFMVQRGGCSIE